jgi:hypothetical protein
MLLRVFYYYFDTLMSKIKKIILIHFQIKNTFQKHHTLHYQIQT